MEAPSYYSVIPADVRYDTTLAPNEKIFFAEITSLTSKTGDCWASNAYFSKLYGVDERSITRWIAKLRKRGYIITKLIYKRGTKQVEKRIINIARTAGTIEQVPPDRNVGTPPDRNVGTPPDRNVGGNSTSESNTTRGNRVIGKPIPHGNESSKDFVKEISEAESVDCSPVKPKVEEDAPQDGKCTADRLLEQFFVRASECGSGSNRHNRFQMRKQIIEIIKSGTPPEDISKAIDYLFSKTNFDQGKYMVKVHRAAQFDADKVNQIMIKVDDLGASVPITKTSGIEGTGVRI